MKIEQIYTGCLAQGAYYLESNGEAAIIDPLREVQQYIDMAKENGAKIKYVFETHFHADFVSGHLDLAQKTGAEIVYGPTAVPGFDATVATDGQEFKLGGVTIKVLHTPGHTMESSCFLLSNEEGKDTALFTGDTLFIGDVGRPDLAQKAANMTQEQLAETLYDSLHNKIMPLDDDIIVYPAHGAGSACGKNMSDETTDTLGHQKKTNYALQEMTKEEFVKQVITGLTPPPQYFPENVMMNKKGYEQLDVVLDRGMKALDADAFEVAAEQEGTLVLDTRDPDVFATGFVPGAINIGVNGNFAPWVGTVIPDIRQRILIVAEEGKIEEVIIRLARVGYDNAVGYLAGGFEAWSSAGKAIATIPSVSAEEFAERYKMGEVNILDVRRKSEYDSQHIIGAKNVPLDYVHDNVAEVDKAATQFVHCAGGYRSMIFTSILKQKGYDNLINVRGGFSKLSSMDDFQLTEYAEPETML